VNILMTKQVQNCKLFFSNKYSLGHSHTIQKTIYFLAINSWNNE